jgi:GNAT superfamily N-acetyltransferase
MSITIKRVSLDDLPGLVPLFDAYRVFYKQASDTAAAKDFLSERLHYDESAIYMALADGVPAGFTQLYPIFSSVSMKRAWLLNDLFVAETFRKQGIAASLIEAACQWAIETESRFLLLQTSEDNIPAQTLYGKTGWVKESDFFYRLDVEEVTPKKYTVK